MEVDRARIELLQGRQRYREREGFDGVDHGETDIVIYDSKNRL